MLDQETAGFIFGEDAYRDPALNRGNVNPEAFRDAASVRLYGIWQTPVAFGEQDAALDVRPYVRYSSMGDLTSTAAESMLRGRLGGKIEDDQVSRIVNAIGGRYLDLQVVIGDVESGKTVDESLDAIVALRKLLGGPAAGGYGVAEMRVRNRSRSYNYEADGFSVYDSVLFDGRDPDPRKVGHEVAHRWFGGIADPVGDGERFLTESLAEAAAWWYAEHRDGPDAARSGAARGVAQRDFGPVHHGLCPARRAWAGVGVAGRGQRRGLWMEAANVPVPRRLGVAGDLGGSGRCGGGGVARVADVADFAVRFAKGVRE